MSLKEKQKEVEMIGLNNLILPTGLL